MRRVVLLLAVAIAACGPVEVEREPCERDSDCSGGMICGKNSGRANSVTPSAPLIAERPAECFLPCDKEITADCALPACPKDGHQIIEPRQFEPGSLNPARMSEQCGDARTTLTLTCDYKQGVVTVSDRAGATSRAWHDGIIGGCDELTTTPLVRWPFAF